MRSSEAAKARRPNASWSSRSPRDGRSAASTDSASHPASMRPSSWTFLTRRSGSSGMSLLSKTCDQKARQEGAFGSPFASAGTRRSISTGSSGGRRKDRSGNVHPGNAATELTRASNRSTRRIGPSIQSPSANARVGVSNLANASYRYATRPSARANSSRMKRSGLATGSPTAASQSGLAASPPGRTSALFRMRRLPAKAANTAASRS